MEYYKSSLYNIPIKSYKGIPYLWNTLSGAIAQIDESIIGFFSPEPTKDINEFPEIETLVRHHFAVPHDFDEYKFVLQRSIDMMNTDNAEDIYFVLAPTLKCNYRCSYCFESTRSSYDSMTEDVVHRVADYIKDKLIKCNNIKRFHITWFGGEPLLCLPTIEKLGRELAQFCQSRGIEYRASLITNGRFLSERAVEVLLRSNIVKLQVSFDGTEETYCAFKKASAEDYRITLENVATAAEKGLPVVIRINIRENDFSSAYDLANLLLRKMNLNGKLRLYPAFVNEGCKEERQEKYKQFVEEEKKFAKYIKTTFSPGAYFNKLAVAHGIPCALICKNNVCIGPRGELYKCEHHFGQAQFITGSIFDAEQTTEFTKKYYQIVRNTLQSERCKSCPVFPICMGGCPNNALLEEQNFDCNSFVAHLIDRQMRVLK